MHDKKTAQIFFGISDCLLLPRNLFIYQGQVHELEHIRDLPHPCNPPQDPSPDSRDYRAQKRETYAQIDKKTIDLEDSPFCPAASHPRSNSGLDVLRNSSHHSSSRAAGALHNYLFLQCEMYGQCLPQLYHDLQDQLHSHESHNFPGSLPEAGQLHYLVLAHCSLAVLDSNDLGGHIKFLLDYSLWLLHL